ncbi:hypothetical protein SASPL_110828 [Salvia splendens]|uniref:Pentatricopeptide repeat-containing protein n=1 Tax=Salvia splendens TaxID=180675 RepID=A0A8X9A1U5_SALSN|nr:hypothetical protein SASPL_110828 [Salvia splendens]
MVNSRHDSPIKEVASSSDVTIEEMFSSIMKEMHEVRDNVNAMQGGFTAFHEDISILRDRIRHNHSIAPSDLERHGRSDYKSRYHDDGLVRESRRERAPMFHRESHSRWMRDHDRHKVHEWLKGEKVSSKASKSSSPRHGGGDTSQRSIPPKKVDLSHPSYHTKVSSWLSSNFPLSKSLIQSECDNVNYIVEERVKHMVDFVVGDDEELLEDEKESTATHEEYAYPTFNDGVSSIVEVEDECEPFNALQILNTEPKPHEELERSKQVHSDERLIYEVQHGREPVDLDFCSITIDGDLNNDILQQRLRELAKQREELQLMEIELRAQNIARSEIARIHSNFDAQITEHGNANVKLQEQLHEKEQNLCELERKIEDKDRELHAIRLDNEAAWAKQDLLREQSKELQSYRRERDSSEAERVQHISQIHELQEHIQEKDRQFMDLQEQHRIAQETLNFKEEQLRDAQAWMTRAHELDALNSSTNHNLQAELRDRTEHYNQLWLACQRQCGEMERLHLHIQQLQLKLVDSREKTGSNMDGSNISHKNLIDASKLEQSNDSQQDVNVNGSQGTNIGSLQNGNFECVSGGNTSTQVDNVQAVAFAPSSLLGISPYAQPGQVTALHPFVIHQQGVPHPSHVMQSHFHSVSTMPSDQNWQQGKPDGQHVPIPNQYDQETEQNLVETHSNIGYKASGNGQILHVTHLETNIAQGLNADSIPSANEDGKVLDSIGRSYDMTQSPESLQRVSSHFRNVLSLDHLEHENDTKEKQVNPVDDHGTENKSAMENPNRAGPVSSERDASVNNFSEKITNNGSSTDKADASVSAGQKSITGNTAESFLLDERMDKRDVVSWNSMISSYAVHGLGSKALATFQEMVKRGVSPTPLTLISVLGACSHSGLVDEGKSLFDSMTREHGIRPSVEHYACIVDLLGRANRLKEAAWIIADMRDEPGAMVWGALLGSCMIHCNVELAERASRMLFELEPTNAGNYVLLAEIYAEAKMWDEVKRMKKVLEEKGLQKVPGCCWIEAKKRVYLIRSVDEVNPQIELVHALMVKLSEEMMEQGYVPETKSVLYELDTEEK